jgi:hypothetical protein
MNILHCLCTSKSTKQKDSKFKVIFSSLQNQILSVTSYKCPFGSIKKSNYV